MQCLFHLHLTAVNLQAKFYQTWQRGRGVKGVMSSQVLWKSAAVCGRGAWLILPQRCCSVSARLLRDRRISEISPETKVPRKAALVVLLLTEQFVSVVDWQIIQARKCHPNAFPNPDFWKQDHASALVTHGTAFWSKDWKEHGSLLLLLLFAITKECD